MLMYMRGLGIQQIARVCRVPARKAAGSASTTSRPRPGTPIATRFQRWTARLELLNTVPGWYRLARNEKQTQSWQEHLGAVTAYVASHGRLPAYRKGHKGSA